MTYASFMVARVALLAFTTCLLACSSNETAPSAAGGTTNPGGVRAPEPCRVAEPGCPCTTPGATLECRVYRKSASGYMECSLGSMVCGEGGKWGECEGNGVWDAAVAD
jgi:hypothetical protein